MGRLLVFNPEQEYSLASGSPWYLPPASIARLAEKLRLLPIFWGETGDYILDNNNLIYRIEPNGIELIDAGEGLPSFEEVDPWGWNQVLVKRLQKLGVDSSLIPNAEFIENVRRLSHRRISIDMNRYLHSPVIPKEFITADGALAYWKENRNCYFKLPWSSGGRGVVDTKELNATQVSEWVRGAIRKQGSVIGESAIDWALQFATLWQLKENEVIFEGFSLPLSDGRGKYKGNVTGDPIEIKNRISSHCAHPIDKVVRDQKSFIEERILPLYSGHLGIDMMADKEGKVYPCVELNLRRTMGHVALAYSGMTEHEKRSIREYCQAPLFELS